MRSVLLLRPKQKTKKWCVSNAVRSLIYPRDTAVVTDSACAPKHATWMNRIVAHGPACMDRPWRKEVTNRFSHWNAFNIYAVRPKVDYIFGGRPLSQMEILFFTAINYFAIAKWLRLLNWEETKNCELKYVAVAIQNDMRKLHFCLSRKLIGWLWFFFIFTKPSQFACMLCAWDQQSCVWNNQDRHGLGVYNVDGTMIFLVYWS